MQRTTANIEWQCLIATDKMLMLDAAQVAEPLVAQIAAEHLAARGYRKDATQNVWRKQVNA